MLETVRGHVSVCLENHFVMLATERFLSAARYHALIWDDSFTFSRQGRVFFLRQATAFLKITTAKITKPPC